MHQAAFHALRGFTASTAHSPHLLAHVTLVFTAPGALKHRNKIHALGEYSLSLLPFVSEF
jgi:predicted N-acyltransferase